MSENVEVQLPDKLTDAIGRVVAEQMDMRWQEFVRDFKGIPVEPDVAVKPEIDPKKQASIKMLKDMGFENPEEVYNTYYNKDTFDVGGEE